MSETPLFYASVVPLNRETHRGLKVGNTDRPFAFAANTHIIPAVIDEFASAARFMPIVFLSGGKAPSPVFLVGLRPGQNAFVTPQGAWDTAYVPAYLRRYPFILGEVEGRDPLICIDEKFDGLGASGQMLFNEDGTESAFLKERITLVNGYLQAAKRTEAFCATLQDLNLLRPITIETRRPGGESSVMHGVLAVDEPKLATLSQEQFLRLRSEGLLAPIYSHLVSLGNIASMGEKVEAPTAEAA